MLLQSKRKIKKGSTGILHLTDVYFCSLKHPQKLTTPLSLAFPKTRKTPSTIFKDIQINIFLIIIKGLNTHELKNYLNRIL